MAKQKAETKKDTESKATLPEGYVSTRAEKGAWLVIGEGATFEGRFLGRFKSRMNQGHYLQFRALKSGSLVVSGRKDDRKEYRCAEGDIVNVDERAQLREVGELAPNNFDVYLHFVGKEKIDGGKTVWIVECGKREVGAASDQTL